MVRDLLRFCKKLSQKKSIAEIPFYLLNAYDNTLIRKYVSSSVGEIYSKPLTKDLARCLLLKATKI